MFTIKRAVELTGVPAGTLRAWEQRYGIGSPRRTDSGYRLYDQTAISEIQSMQRLVAAGWPHAEAAAEVQRLRNTAAAPAASNEGQSDALSERFLDAARNLDAEGISATLDEAFAQASFEFVIDHWLTTTLRKLGEEWAAGQMDIASEHFASGAVMRRLGAAFESAGSANGAQRVLVGAPAGSFHEMGALALAAAMRRRGIGVVFLGNNVPPETWVDSVERHQAAGVVVSVVMPQDVAAAQQTVDGLHAAGHRCVIAVGGPAAGLVVGADLVLAGGIADAARMLAAQLGSSEVSRN